MKIKIKQCDGGNFVKKVFFYLDAAWLNEGRCPGGRPSVSEN